MKVQYSNIEISKMLSKYEFKEITFDVENLNKKTSKIEAILFERKIKFELMYINKKYDYLYSDEIDPIILQIFDIDNKLLSTICVEKNQDLLILSKTITNDYDDLVMMCIAKNKEGLGQRLNIENLKNYTFVVFKVED